MLTDTPGLISSGHSKTLGSAFPDQLPTDTITQDPNIVARDAT